MGSDGESKRSRLGRLARLVRVVRVLLMTSGAAAVSWGALLTDAGGTVTSGVLHYARDVMERLPVRFERFEGLYTPAAPPVSEPAPPPLLPYRPAWYSWRATEHDQGDQVPSLGAFNMIVLTPDGPALTSSAVAPADVSFSFEPLGEISVSLSLRLPTWTGQRIALLSGRTELTALEFSGSDIVFGDHRENYRSAGCLGEHDEVTITLAGTSARLWCNGRFVGIQVVRHLPLSQVHVSGLVRKRDYLYSMIVHAGRE